MHKLFKYLFGFVVVIVSITVFSTAAHAATLYWVGSSGGNTATAANWSTASGACTGAGNGTAPVAGDTLNFTSSCNNDATVGSTLSADSVVTTGGTGYTGTITTTAGITLTRNLTVSSLTTFTGAGVIYFNGQTGTLTLTCNGTLGSPIRFTGLNAVNFVLSSNCSASTQASPTWSTWGTGSITISSNATLTIPSGTWTVNTTSGAGAALTNNGTITHNGVGWAIGSGMGFTNNGTITYSGTSLSLTAGNFTNSGTFTASSLTTLTLNTSGNFTNNSSGTLTIGATTITVPGTFTQSGTLNNMTGVTIFNGTAGTQTLTCSGDWPGTIRVVQGGTAAFVLSAGCSAVVDRSVVWTGGNGGIRNNGTMTVSTSTWTIGQGAAGASYTNFNNYGTIYHNGTGWTFGSSGSGEVGLNNTATGDITYAGSTITIGGDFTQSGDFDLTGKLVIMNSSLLSGGAMSLSCSGNLGGSVRVLATGGNSFTLVSGCSIVVDTAAGWTAGNGGINNSGTMLVSGGSWTIGAGSGASGSGLTNSGQITLTGVAAWSINTNNAHFTNNSTGVITIGAGTSWSITTNSNYQTSNYGTINHSGSAWTLSKSYQRNNFVNYSTGVVNYSGATMNVAGDFYISSGSQFNAPNSTIVLTGNSFTGTITCTGTLEPKVRVTGAVGMAVASGCTVEVDTTVTWTPNNTISNSGTMRVSSTTATWTISFASTGNFYNYGTITHDGIGWNLVAQYQEANFNNTNTGIVTYAGKSFNLQGDFTQNGTFDTEFKVINFNGGSVTNVLTCTGTLPGSVRVSMSVGQFQVASGCSITVDPTNAWVTQTSLTNNGTMTIASSTWTVTFGSSGTFTNNGTIVHDGTGWTVNSSYQQGSFTNSSTGVVTYAGSGMSIQGSFAQQGSFTRSGSANPYDVTVTLYGWSLSASLTCPTVGTAMSVSILNSIGGGLTLTNTNCTAFNGDLTHNSGTFVSTPTNIQMNRNLTVAANFGSVSNTVTMAGVGSTFTLNGGTFNPQVAWSNSGSGYAIRYGGGTWTGLASLTLDSLFASFTQTGGTWTPAITFTGNNQSFTVSGGAFNANLNFSGSGVTFINKGGSSAAGTTTIDQSSGYAVLSGNSVFWNLVITSGDTLDSSPDGGSTSYNTTLYNDYQFGGTFLERNGTFIFDHNGRSKTMDVSSLTLNNVTLTSAESAASYSTVFTNGLNMAGNLTIQTTGGSATYSHTWAPTNAATFSLGGNFTMTQSGAVPALNASITTFNMTGTDDTFTVTGGSFAPATLNFDGTGRTVYNRSTTPSSGTVVIGQSSGSVVLARSVTFYVLTIDSGAVLDASPDSGVNSYNILISYNFTNNGGSTGFVARAGTITFSRADTATQTVRMGGAAYYNVVLGGDYGGHAGYTALTFADSFSVTNNFTLTRGGLFGDSVATWTASTPITISIAGNFSSVQTTSSYGILSSNITLNMTGDSKSFTATGNVISSNVNFNGTGTTTVIRSSNSTGGMTTINQSSGYVALSGNSIFYSLTINPNNILDTSPNGGITSYSLRINGSLVNNAGSTGFNARNNTVTFNSANVSPTYKTGGISFYNLTLASQDSLSYCLRAAFTDDVNVTGDLFVTENGGGYAGMGHVWGATVPMTFFVGGNVNITWTTGQVLYFGEPGAVYGGTFNNRTYITVTMTGADKTFTSTGSNTILNGQFNFYGSGTTLVTQPASNPVGGVIVNQVSGGVVLASSATFPSLTINQGTYSSAGYTTTVTSNLSINAGTFTASSGTTNVGGNFYLNGGTFNHNGGTFVLNGGSQQIITNQNITFNNLTKSSSNSTLTFNSGYTYTVLGTSTLSGSATNARLKLTPSLNGTAWNFDPQGVRTFSNLSPWYSNNVNATAISAINSAVTATPLANPPGECAAAVSFCDRGYNSGWDFGANTLKAYWVGPAGGSMSGNYWASASGGVAGTAVPSSAYILYFDNGGTNNAVIDSAFGSTYAGINIASTYTGTITQARSINFTSYTQAGGVFNGSGSSFTATNFTQTGGTFNAPTSMSVSGTLSETGGVFNASSTVTTSSFNHSGGLYNAGAALNVSGTFTDNSTTAGAESGLVGYWKLDEASGGSAADSSGNGNTGTWVGSQVPDSSVPSAMHFTDPYGLGFNGISQYVTAPAVLPSGSNATYSTSLWAKTGGVSSSAMMLSDRDSGGYNYKYIMQYNANNTVTAGACTNDACGTASTVSSPVLSTNTWHHIAATFNNTSNSIYLYIDGTNVGSSTAAFDSTGNRTNTIGAWRAPVPTVYHFPGSIDDVRIYNRVLSAAEVTVLANGYASTSAATGSFLANTGTVTLNGTSQSLLSQGTATTTFYNLTKSVASSATLTFTAAKSVAISNMLTLTASGNAYLSLRSSSSGTQWKILPSETDNLRSLSHLDVKDSNNLASTSMAASDGSSLNSGNNTNWTFTIPITTFSATGTQVTSTEVPTTTRTMMGGAFTAMRNSGAGTISSIAITNSGSLSSSYLANVKMYYNTKSTSATACDTGLTLPGDAVQFGSTITNQSSSRFTFSGSTMPVDATARLCIYLQYETTGTASATSTDYRTINFTIAAPLTDVTLDTGSALPLSTIDITGATTISATSAGVAPSAGSTLSLRMPDGTDTIFYYSSNAVWMRQGVSQSSPGTTIRMTPSNIVVTNVTFKLQSNSNNAVTMTLTLQETDPKNPQRNTYSRTFTMTANVKASQ